MWEARFTWKARQILYHGRDSDRKSQTGKRRAPFSNCVLTFLNASGEPVVCRTPLGFPSSALLMREMGVLVSNLPCLPWVLFSVSLSLATGESATCS